jgi:hypothetical protein
VSETRPSCRICHKEFDTQRKVRWVGFTSPSFSSRPLILEPWQQPYQLCTSETLSLSYPRMSRQNDEDAQVWPIGRPYSPSAISTSRDLSTAETALSSVHLSETIDSSKGQCTETSHAGAWIEETRREGCYHNDWAPVRFLNLFDESFDDIFALMVLRLLLIDISEPYITPKFRQETQRTILWRRCAINDLVWSSYAPSGASAPVQQQDSVWRRRTPPKPH